MKDTKYLEILKAPVVTEKSENARNEGKYTFKVDSRANKLEIKEAIEKIFKVEVVIDDLVYGVGEGLSKKEAEQIKKD